MAVDIHDQAELQNAQLDKALVSLRSQGKDMHLTYWLADDCLADCLVGAPLPLTAEDIAAAKLKRANGPGYLNVTEARDYHVHSDAGLMIFRGRRARQLLLDQNSGRTFGQYLAAMAHGAQAIPHGIDEMAFDMYLAESPQNAAHDGWARLREHVSFDVHRALMENGTQNRDARGGSANAAEFRADALSESVNLKNDRRYENLVRDPTTWTIFQQDGPNHLGLW